MTDDEILGRRLRCTACGERVPDDDRAYEHARDCYPEARITAPYWPDTHPDVATTVQTTLSGETL